MSQLPNFLQVRAVVLVNFPAQIPPGREQENTRPAVIVALPNVTGITRFSLVIVVPLTTQQGDWAATQRYIRSFRLEWEAYAMTLLCCWIKYALWT